MASVKFNDNVKLIISDVDETIAELFTKAKPEMIAELQKILDEGKVLFLITGQSIQSIQWRITDHIKPTSRKQIIAGTCSGSEVQGFDFKGDIEKKPYYSIYDTVMNDSQKKKWREITKQLISEFNLKVYDSMTIKKFSKLTKKNPLAIMMEDRGPQITFEVVNGIDLDSKTAKKLNVQKTDGIYDLRIPIIKRAKKLLGKLPITPRIAGVFAIDFAIKDVSKTTAVKNIIENKQIMSKLSLSRITCNEIKVWGDKFSVTKGGTDRHISEALPKEVRSISFRLENPDEFPKGYNIVIWSGKKYLHHGLLEYLGSRK